VHQQRRKGCRIIYKDTLNPKHSNVKEDGDILSMEDSSHNGSINQKSPRIYKENTEKRKSSGKEILCYCYSFLQSS
jgi:hypothetical protein